MSLPPATVQIKRKRGIEPPDILRVHETNGKRQRRETEFVFSRQSQASEVIENRIIKPLPKTAIVDSLQSQINQTATQQVSSGGESSSIARLASKAGGVRKFHISRKETSSTPTVASGRVKKRSSTTIFVERRSRPNSRPTSSRGKEKAISEALADQASKLEQVRPQKKPGLASRTQSNRSRDGPTLLATPPVTEVRLPSGELKPWDEASDELAAEMQAYTLQAIGHNEKGLQPVDIPESTPQRKVQKSRFTPKKPALRYKERHPEENHDGMDMDVDVDDPIVSDDEMEDEGEYIIDTYIRMPAHEVDAEKIFGLLVLESQPDIDEFYIDDSDQEEQENDDEEDENAEDHYTADYPDEEVDSDDEYGRNAYNYRNNGSDQEEFDEDDAAFSDDEGEKMRHPWGTKPAWLR